MPIIYSYPIINVLNGADMFVISKSPADPSIDEWETKSITAESVATYVAGKIDLNFIGDTGNGIVNIGTQSLTISGTSNEIETAASSQTLQIGLPDNVIIQNNLTVGNDIQVNNDVQVDGSLTVNNLTQTETLQVDSNATISSVLTMEDEIDMSTNRIINLGDPSSAQDAATKSYVDTLVSGGLSFRGSFRADTGEILSGANTGSYLYNCPGGAGTRVAVEIGDYYVVSNASGNFYCSGDLLNIGDSIIAVADSPVDSSVVTDWSIVESNNVEGTGLANTIPIWTDSQVLGNSNISQGVQGDVTINANTTINDELTMGNTILMDGNVIDELPSPTGNSEATNKAYVDGLTTTNANNITTNTNDIAVLQTDVSTNTTNISTNASDITGKVDKAGDTMTGDLTILKTANNPILRVQSEETVGDQFQSAIINVRSKETSTNTETVGAFKAHGPNSINTGGAGNVVIQNQSAAGGQVVIASKAGPPTGTTYWNRFKTNGQVQFEEYGSGTLTGTAAYNLSVDANGNLIETANPSAPIAPTWQVLSVQLSGNSLVNVFNGNLSDQITLLTVPANHFAKILEVTGVIYGASTGTTDYNSNNSLYVKRAGSVTGGSFSAPEIFGNFINSSTDQLTNSNGQPVAAQSNALSTYGGLGADIVLGPSTTGPVTITQGDRTLLLSITYRLINFTP